MSLQQNFLTHFPAQLNPWFLKKIQSETVYFDKVV